MNTKQIQTSDTLSWIKNELDELIDQARKELVVYIEENQDPSLLKKVKEILLQLRATLETVEIYGASMLVREVSDLVEALTANSVENKHDAYELLLQAMLMLPDYLEHVQQNNNEVPLVLLPYLNDLRTVRNSELLSAQVLFFPDLNTVNAPISAQHTQPQNVRALAKRLRYTFQVGLLGWFRGTNVDVNLARIQKVTSYLYQTASADASRRLWWIVSAVLQALSTGGLASSVTVKTLLGKVDRQLKILVDDGDQLFAKQIPDELINNLLYYLAISKESGELVKQVRKAYALSELIPDESKLKSIRESISGPNAGIWDTVSKAICEDLAEVKDNLEIFVTDDEKNPAFLEKINLKLHQISDTLAMLGLNEVRKKVLEHADVIQGGIEDKTSITDSTVLSMAGMMLELESLILDFASSPNKTVDPKQNDVSSFYVKEPESRLSEVEHHKLLESVVSESNKEIEKVKDLLLDYIESPQESEPLSVVPQYLGTVRGALLLAGMKEASEITKSISDYVSNVILQSKKVPLNDELEMLAEAFTNLECYLEASKRGAEDASSYLDAGIRVVKSLGFAISEDVSYVTPAAQESQKIDESDSHTLDEQALKAESPNDISRFGEEEIMLKSDQYGSTERVDEAKADESELVPPSTEERAEHGHEKIPILSGDVDQDILEIFLEEAAEELETIKQLLPVWQRDSDNYDTLSEMRRSFHTLKGSGRLVGAELLGEFAWAFEDMLNRVIERTVPVSTELNALLIDAVNLLPQLIDQLQGQSFPDIDPYSLIDKTCALRHKDSENTQSIEGVRKVI